MWTVDHGLILNVMLILGIRDILESFLMNLLYLAISKVKG